VNVWGVPSVGVWESKGTLWFYIHAILSVLQLMFEVCLWLVFGSRKGQYLLTKKFKKLIFARFA
jgi:hypothetical protein